MTWGVSKCTTNVQIWYQGFVLAPELTYSPVACGVLVEGYVRCEGGLYLQVQLDRRARGLGGELTARSELGVGSEFELRLKKLAT